MNRGHYTVTSISIETKLLEQLRKRSKKASANGPLVSVSKLINEAVRQSLKKTPSK